MSIVKPIFTSAALLLLLSTGHAAPPAWTTPASAVAIGETNWGGTWYTGPAALALDGDGITAWTYAGLGAITFDMGAKYEISGIDATWGGHVTNGNTVNVSIDGQGVLFQQQLSAGINIRKFSPVVGQYITYTTLPLPHNVYRQIATWSEIGEFKALAQPVPEPETMLLFAAGLVAFMLRFSYRAGKIQA